MKKLTMRSFRNKKGEKRMKAFIQGANPYLPLWEHVPDGEPRVFEYNGEKRVYLYGSHDTEKTAYCGTDYVVWSAPVNDLTDWKCHGVCYDSPDGNRMYAPDAIQKGDTFYLYAAENKNSRLTVAKSRHPAGPFTDAVRAEIGCDPGVLVDDDGRIFGYWGFCNCCGAEFHADMATIKEGTLRSHLIGHCESPWTNETEHVDYTFGFYEAASPRKILGKYVLLYSRNTNEPLPEYGIEGDCNGFLSYAYSDHPLEGYRFGGEIILNGGEIIPDGKGGGKMTYRWGNNHGGLAEINGQWYIFYHRQTGKNEYARQAMLEPVDIAMDKNGRLFIGDITYREGEPIASRPVEMTSQGAHINGLDACKIISAGYACHLSGGAKEAYIAPVYEKEEISAPIREITNGVTAGFRYLQFGLQPLRKVTVKACASSDIRIRVHLDNHEGKIIGELALKAGEREAQALLSCGVIGTHAVYFEFLCPEGTEAEFDWFTFDRD